MAAVSPGVRKRMLVEHRRLRARAESSAGERPPEMYGFELYAKALHINGREHFVWRYRRVRD